MSSQEFERNISDYCICDCDKVSHSSDQTSVRKPVIEEAANKENANTHIPNHQVVTYHDRPNIGDLVVQWADYTTVHGIRFLVPDNENKRLDCFSIRRFAWLLILLLCSGVVIKQVSARIVYFMEKPISVNIMINTTEHILPFPTITICNQNPFKISKAINSGHFYSLSEALDNQQNIDHFENTNLTMSLKMDEIFNITSFTIEDMLIKCTWLGEECKADNFTPTFTNKGLCFSFNARKPYKHVDNSGSGNGLSLLLNTQQYESIPTGFSSSGILFAAHPYNEVPLLSDVGYAAATGTHTLVGLRRKVIHNDALREQTCGKKNYSFQKCFLNCRRDYYLRLPYCGCREAFMPDETGNSTICNLKQFLVCSQRARDEFTKTHHTYCHSICPINCVELEIDTNLSIFALSHEGVEENNDSRSIINAMTKNHVESRDIINQALEKNYKKNLALYSEAFGNLTRLNTGFWNAFWKMKRMEEEFDEEKKYHFEILKYKLNQLEEQKFIVQKVFYDGYESARIRTLNAVASKFFEFKLNLEETMEALTNRSINYDSRFVMAYNIKIAIKQRLAATKSAFNKVRELVNCYEKGNPYWEDRLPDGYTLEKVTEIVPQRLLAEAVKPFGRLGKWNQSLAVLPTLITCYEDLIRLVDKTLGTSKYSRQSLKIVIKDFIQASKTWEYFGKNTMTEAFYSPIQKLSVKIGNGTKQYDQRSSPALDGSLDYSTIKSTIMKITGHNTLSEVQNVLGQFLKGQILPIKFPQKKHCMKSWLAKYFQSHRVELSLALQQVDNAFQEINLYRVQWPERWHYFNRLIADAWRYVIYDKNSHNHFEIEKRHSFLNMSVQELKRELTNKKNSFMGNLACTKDEHGAHCGTEYGKAVTVLMMDLKKYLDDGEINSYFIRNNVVQIDFFYRMMVTEVIIKQWSYYFTALLSDIGGALGLFVGGSIVSVFEVIDLLVRMCHRARVRKSTSGVTAEEKMATTLSDGNAPCDNNHSAKAL